MQNDETWDPYMLLDAVPVGILVLRSDMTVLFWNNYPCPVDRNQQGDDHRQADRGVLP